MYRLAEAKWKEYFEQLFTDLDDKETQEKFVEEIEKVERDAELAAQAVASKLDEVWTNCWECGITVKDMKVCSRCSVARYCNRECQVAAWHGSHKNACPDHKTKYASFLEDLQITELGFYPDKHTDY